MRHQPKAKRAPAENPALPPAVARSASRNADIPRTRYKARIELPIEDGCVFLVSDEHYDPQETEPSPAHRAAVKLALKMKPWAIVNNGDTIDSACISRWPVGSYSELGERPGVNEELEVARLRLQDFERLPSPKWLTWNLGNHDARYETKLADTVPQYAGVPGFTLKEHFPDWAAAWRTDFVPVGGGKPELIIKHRLKGGMYSAANNSLWAGTSIATGHDHALWAKAITDVNGIRWGIDAGTLAPVNSRLFVNYTEDNIVNWQSGFVILHFENDKFTGPELVYATSDGKALFRGKDVLAS